MSLNINKVRQSGFTIVELLIVVVVIAILAAITIVSYNGITTQANESASKSAASTFQKKAELFYADKGRYPVSSDLGASADSTKSWFINTGYSYTADPDSTNGKNTVRVATCPPSATAANITGLQIHRWLYEAATPALSASSPDSITLGSC